MQEQNTTQTAPPQMPTIMGTLASPAMQKRLLIISIVFNLIFFIVILTLNGGNSPATTVTTPRPTVKATTPTPTTKPSKLTDDQLCFAECTKEELLNRLNEKYTAIKSYKILRYTVNHIDKQCFAAYVETANLINEYTSYLIHKACLDFAYSNSLPSTSIKIDSDFYQYNANKWEKGVTQATTISSLQELIQTMQKQQNIVITTEGSYKILSGSSKFVNELNQVVNREFSIKFDQSLNLVFYEDDIQNTSFEQGSIFDLGITNKVLAPF